MIVAGRAGARLARRLGLSASRDTLVRLVRAMQHPAHEPCICCARTCFVANSTASGTPASRQRSRSAVHDLGRYNSPVDQRAPLHGRVRTEHAELTVLHPARGPQVLPLQPQPISFPSSGTRSRRQPAHHPHRQDARHARAPHRGLRRRPTPPCSAAAASHSASDRPRPQPRSSRFPASGASKPRTYACARNRGSTAETTPQPARITP